MTRATNYRTRGATERNERAASEFVRDTRPFSERLAESIDTPALGSVFLVCGGGVAVFIPSLADLLFAVMALYLVYAIQRRVRLPIRFPKASRVKDYGDLKPGSHTPKMAEGILFVGNDRDSEEECWLSNDDARRHILLLGTTGAGKSELLKSLVTNALTWGSGFLYIDGKGDNSLWADIYSLARRFGRDDDLLVINYMTASAKGRVLSNTLNPFMSESASALTELVVSLMDDGGSDPMWKSRAIALITPLIHGLVELRDKEDGLLSVERVREHLNLKRVIDLYYRGETRGELTRSTTEGIKAYLDSVPGFKWENARQGKLQEGKALEQHGYLQMQFTRIFSMLVDTYDFIYGTELGEVDLLDVVLNRRILVVLLPALEKSEDEVSQLGKIIVASLRGMMGKTLGTELEGSREDIVESKPTNSPSPYQVVFDEVGYYMTRGMAIQAAQARSLGFSMIFSSQDLNSMRKKGGETEKEVGAILGNTGLKGIMSVEDPEVTQQFYMAAAGKARVTRAAGFSSRADAVFAGYADNLAANIETEDRIDPTDIKAQREGEVHFLPIRLTPTPTRFSVGHGCPGS